MTQFPDFDAKHGPPFACRPATASSIRTYAPELPAPLVDAWREEGWCGYAEGLIWTVDPADFAHAVEEWLGPDDSSVAILRTGFGDLVVWDESGARYLDVIHDKVFPLTDDPEILFDYVLCRAEYLTKVLDQKLFQKAVEKLGPLAHDECFAFEPAIALGGPGTLATIKKRKLREYLGILAQLRSEP
jgi:hypothetical protein